MTAFNATRRRFLLRGVMGGAMVTVGLPFLDMFLDNNGEALAATRGGGALPVRFGTWYWGCGMIPNRWVPTKTGADYDLPPQLEPLKPVQNHVTILSGFNVELDGRANLPHLSGATGLRTGDAAESWAQIINPTFDVEIADVIGSGTLFRSLELSADGNARSSLSYRNGASMNAATASPLELYQKIFGPDFRDPGAADFTPDPKIMTRRSVLSAVGEERRALLQQAGAEDRARLDQFFTSVRDVEQKLAMQLERPAPAEACRVPTTPLAVSGDLSEIGPRLESHRLMTEILAMALACNQTRVFNMHFSGVGLGDLRRPGDTTAYHQTTHEEMVDRKIGYQPRVDKFAIECMQGWADFVAVLASVKEGAGTLLDRSLVLAHSEVSYAKNHDVNGVPMMLAGSCGGRVTPGLHIDGTGTPASRVVLTAQQVLGLTLDKWGSQSMQTNKSVSEIIA